MKGVGESETLGQVWTEEVDAVSVTRRMDTFCSGFAVNRVGVGFLGFALGMVEFSEGITAVK